MKKAQLFISSLMLTSGLAFGQQVYDLNGSQFQNFGPRNGKLDSLCVNPGVNDIHNSKQCAKYERKSTAKYDNIKIYLQGKLVDVTPYATYKGIPPKITMKIYSSAPVGTKVELQLGKKGNDNYPAGIHSQYEAVTTVQNAWEILTFTFSQIPQGSLIAPTEVDQITLLFSPNSSRADTYYFDDLTGPALTPATATMPKTKEDK